MSNSQSDQGSATYFVSGGVMFFLFMIMSIALAFISTNWQGMVTSTLFSLFFLSGIVLVYRNYQRARLGVLQTDSTRMIQFKEQAILLFIILIIFMVYMITATSMVEMSLYTAISLLGVAAVIERYRKSCEVRRRVELLKSDSEP